MAAAAACSLAPDQPPEQEPPRRARDDDVAVEGPAIGGAAKRIFTFRPASKTTIRTQQIMLDGARFRAEPDKCKAALAG